MNKTITFRALGTINSIRVYENIDNRILNNIEQLVMSMDDRWSVFKENSEISQLNKYSGIKPVHISSDTLYLLTAARKFSMLSAGAFSITIGPLSDLWRHAIKTQTLPNKIALEKARLLVNDAAIILDAKNSTAYLPIKGQAIDLGSIAKGYAIDRVRQTLVASGIKKAVLNFGGTVSIIGRTYSVGIQHPRKSTGIPFGSLTLSDTSIVTSGDYEQNFSQNDKILHHIIDPRTGEPCQSGLSSVTLVGPDAMTLDALSTAFFVDGPENGIKLLSEFNTEAIIITNNLDVLCTEKLQEHINIFENLNRKDMAQ